MIPDQPEVPENGHFQQIMSEGFRFVYII